MSELLGKLTEYVRNLPQAEVRVVLGDGSADEGHSVLAEAQPRSGGSDLEGRSIDAVPVGDPELGRFTCFMDGMQRPRGPIYITKQPVPILYGYIAAVVRVRGSDRRMRTLKGYHKTDEALYFSQALMSSIGVDIEGIDAKADKNDLSEHPLALVQAARDKISTRRGKLESDLVACWLAEYGGGCEWLMVDGSLGAECSGNVPANVVGVTKSHATQYFEWHDQKKILDLNVGERSGVFIPIIAGRRRPVYSWYLRLRPNDGQDVYFGLVRVEAQKSQRTLDMADEISRWLLAERCPLSLPDFRWDKMIYPIRDCEQYLKSLAPTHTSLDAMLIKLSRMIHR
ncbi:MAG: hypothetical protein ABFD54_13455 [Armatimonadota bacterium]|nr:hypothetical protein [bacterium]